jgi:SET domain-containing protein
MLLIEHFLKEVPGKGIGLFTAQDIKKGEMVWKLTSIFSKQFTQKEVEEMGKVQQDFMEKYAILEPNGYWLLDLDNSRFFNHSNNPNIVWAKGEMDGYAAWDIKAGEEITIDYTTMDTKPLNFIDTESGGGI